MLHVFNTLTTDTGSTWLLLGEYGAVTAAMGLLLGMLFWSLRTRLPKVSTPEPGRRRLLAAVLRGSIDDSSTRDE
jgi:hypothetical protein